MFQTDDTIVAIATPPGRGGIGVVRLSGPDAARIAGALSGRAEALQPRHATLARIELRGGVCDQVVLTSFPAPHSYTGDDVVEISAHGSPVLLHGIVGAAAACGARLAEPGEFTLRAFLNRRIDLVQAEAVRDLIDAVTPLQARAAFDQLEGTLTASIRDVESRLFDLTARLEASLDFPEEGYHFVERDGVARELGAIAGEMENLLKGATAGRMLREGVQVVITGRPNTGKSSLFNALAGAGRAIVTDAPGTTRDLVTETIAADGIPMTLVDTAGVHTAAADPVEAEGIARAVAARSVATLVLLVLDRSEPLIDDDRRLLEETGTQPRVVAANKADLPLAWQAGDLNGTSPVSVSARTGEGIEELRRAIVAALTGREALRDVPPVTNLRHARLLEAARAALQRAGTAAAEGTPEEFVLADINEARAQLEAITGARTPEDVLRAIFERFCIGK